MTKKCTGMIEHCFGILSEVGGGGGRTRVGTELFIFVKLRQIMRRFRKDMKKITKFRVFRQKTDFRIFRENSFVPTLGGRSCTKQHATHYIQRQRQQLAFDRIQITTGQFGYSESSFVHTLLKVSVDGYIFITIIMLLSTAMVIWI